MLKSVESRRETALLSLGVKGPEREAHYCFHPQREHFKRYGLNGCYCMLDLGIRWLFELVKEAG
jgi:hypothetical protein